MNDISEQQNMRHEDGLLDDVVMAAQHTSVSPIPVIPQLSIALGLLMFVFSVSYIGVTQSIVRNEKTPDNFRVVETPSQLSNTIEPLHSFVNVEIMGKSAIVLDVLTGEMLFSKDADARLPLASITKLMTALIAYEILPPQSLVTIDTDAIREDGDTGFSEGESFEKQDLIDLTLIESSNDGARALGAAVSKAIESSYDSNAVFIKAMNTKARELGLAQTSYQNSTGLDVSQTEAGAYGSARDTANLLAYMLTHASDAIALTENEVAKISNNEGDTHIVHNTNKIVADIDGLIASKTGYTDLAGGNLVVAVNLGVNRPIIAVVLGSTFEGRFSDIETLVNEARIAVIK